MALCVAHVAAGIGFARTRDLRTLCLLALVSVSPDFDFALVWGLGLPIEVFHRTFSHSILFAALASGFYAVLFPFAHRTFSGWLVFLGLASHLLVDMVCTADAVDHGVMLFWPFSDLRLGWPIVVPLYARFSESPFSVKGVFRFTLLEILLAPVYWGSTALVGIPIRRLLFPRPREK